MRRRVVIVPLLLLAGVLLARRRRRMRAGSTPLAAAPQEAPVALLESGARFVSVPWTLVESDPADPRLRIRCYGDEHMQLDRVDAQETPTQVFVTALMRWSPPAAGWFANARQHEAVISLSGPLGTRELVHTPVDVETTGEPASSGPSTPPLYP
ncbi:MAG TPA: hypothetical protein VKB03_03030 [Conexibacter sp.]|nr:hypothetical protein [Conexibacter sp.]